MRRLTVRRNNTGRTGSSTICCITTARTSYRKTSVIEKHMPIAVIQKQGRISTTTTTLTLTIPITITRSNAPSIVLFKPISFSDSCNNTINSAGCRSSLCRTRGRFDVTLPNVCGGVVTIDSNTFLTSCLVSAVPFSIDTMRGKYWIISA